MRIIQIIRSAITIRIANTKSFSNESNQRQSRQSFFLRYLIGSVSLSSRTIDQRILWVHTLLSSFFSRQWTNNSSWSVRAQINTSRSDVFKIDETCNVNTLRLLSFQKLFETLLFKKYTLFPFCEQKLTDNYIRTAHWKILHWFVDLSWFLLLLSIYSVNCSHVLHSIYLFI